VEFNQTVWSLALLAQINKGYVKSLQAATEHPTSVRNGPESECHLVPVSGTGSQVLRQVTAEVTSKVAMVVAATKDASSAERPIPVRLVVQYCLGAILIKNAARKQRCFRLGKVSFWERKMALGLFLTGFFSPEKID
jgi:hypothetical protein